MLAGADLLGSGFHDLRGEKIDSCRIVRYVDVISCGSCITSDFVLFPVFVKETPYTALRHTLHLRQVIERGKLVLLFRHCRNIDISLTAISDVTRQDLGSLASTKLYARDLGCRGPRIQYTSASCGAFGRHRFNDVVSDHLVCCACASSEPKEGGWYPASKRWRCCQLRVIRPSDFTKTNPTLVPPNLSTNWKILTLSMPNLY